MALLVVLCLPEARGLIHGLYFLIFKHREVRNSTKKQNAILIMLEIWNAACVAFLAFFVLPYLKMFQTLFIPHMMVFGPLVIPILFQANVFPKGWKGVLLDLVGIVFLLGSFALVGLEYYYIVEGDFVANEQYFIIVAGGCLLLSSFHVVNNYQRRERMKVEEGLYWVHFISPIFWA